MPGKFLITFFFLLLSYTFLPANGSLPLYFGKPPVYNFTKGLVLEKGIAITRLSCNDSTKKEVKSVQDTSIYPDPKKAWKRSLMLPGLGQAYNKKYWKIPIIYAGLTGLGYLIWFNDKNYKTYRKALIHRTDDNDQTIDDFPASSIDNLKSQRDYYKRNRDLAIIVTGVWYGLNILDAYVDAHMKGFNVSDDLTIKPGTGNSLGGLVSLKVTF